MAQGLSVRWGQRVIVDNRGSGVLPGDVVSQAMPDGYTLLEMRGGMWQLPLLQSTPTDVFSEFATISLIARAALAAVPRSAIRGGDAARVRDGVNVRPVCPVKVPASIIRQINDDSVRFLKSPDARERLMSTAVEAAPSTPRNSPSRSSPMLIR